MENAINRDFNTISPSARSLLMLKGLTNIPFAKQAAELALYPEKYIPDFTIKDSGFWGRVLHFENRYWSIDQLLQGTGIKNILELSSGFSFRGLEMVKQDGYHYIDTDLPELIKTKTAFIHSLQQDQLNPSSKLETLPLNALDEDAFVNSMDHFPGGEVAIVNEGLLMYLNIAEKEKLCGIIHKILQQRGGCWITADIYIKNQMEITMTGLDEEMKTFLGNHRVEENKFDSFAAAETFFKQQGFVIDKEAQTDYTKLSSLQYLKNAMEEVPGEKRTMPKIRATWRLKISGDK